MATQATKDHEKLVDPTSNNDRLETSPGSVIIRAEHVHPDPILCRLRLNDQFGKPITDPKTYFRDCKVVGFFFATIWRFDRDSVQNNIMDFCQRHPHRFKCIYVSIDSTREDYEMAVKEKPWVNMIWEDGSNDEEGQPKPKRSEDFLTPEHDQLLKEMLAGKVDLKQDPRPVSRVGLCQQLNVLYAPTLAIYHLESKTWLDYHVRETFLSSKEKRQAAWETWEKGEKLEMGWGDIFQGLRWAIMMVVFAIAYTFLVQYDDSFNLANIVEKFSNPAPSASSPLPGAPSPKIAEYVEF